MSIQAVHPVFPTRRALAGVLLPLAFITGCASGSTSVADPARTGTPGSVSGQVSGSVSGSPGVTASTPAAVSTSPGPTASPVVDASGAVAAARPDGVATCTSLTAARAQGLLGAPVGAGTRDPRKGESGRRQLDGCSFSANGGLRLAYLVWRIPTTATRADVEKALPTEQMGARVFAPGLGGLSAGAVMVTGPVAVAQVNVASGGRLIQVTVTAKEAGRATSVATDAARALAGG